MQVQLYNYFGTAIICMSQSQQLLTLLQGTDGLISVMAKICQKQDNSCACLCYYYSEGIQLAISLSKCTFKVFRKKKVGHFGISTPLVECVLYFRMFYDLSESSYNKKRAEHKWKQGDMPRHVSHCRLEEPHFYNQQGLSLISIISCKLYNKYSSFFFVRKWNGGTLQVFNGGFSQ